MASSPYGLRHRHSDTRKSHQEAIPNGTPKSPFPDAVPLFPSTSRLLTYDELPNWLQDNHFIRTSYRPPSGSILTSLVSAFTLHNETVNVQSHLWGAISFAVFALCSTTAGELVPAWMGHLKMNIRSAFPAAVSASPIQSRHLLALLPPPLRTAPLPFSPLLPFLLGALTCLTLSALFHCTSNVSPHVARLGNSLDYLGIIALISGSFVSSTRLAFTCHPSLSALYTVAIALPSAALAVLCLLPRFRTPGWRPVRAGLFVGLGLVAVVPMVHGRSLWGWEGVEMRLGATQMLVEGSLYIGGATIYAGRVPERWTGRCDVWGASHQVFHLLVVAAAWCHLWGLGRALEWKAGMRC